jgi:hypothetical protein
MNNTFFLFLGFFRYLERYNSRVGFPILSMKVSFKLQIFILWGLNFSNPVEFFVTLELSFCTKGLVFAFGVSFFFFKTGDLFQNRGTYFKTGEYSFFFQNRRSKVELVLSYGSQFSEFIFYSAGPSFRCEFSRMKKDFSYLFFLKIV